jgi:hypothetical protein
MENIINTDELLLSIIKNLDRDNPLREVIDKALKEQDYVYNGEYFQAIHTNPLYAAFDDDSIFKIGDTIRNIYSGITAKVKSYYDGGYLLSNGVIFPAKDKDNWEIKTLVSGTLSEDAFNICRENTNKLISYKIKNLSDMEDYEIIGWPDIQELMDKEGFEDNATLIEPNDNMDIGSSTYLVDKEWLESLDKEE